MFISTSLLFFLTTFKNRENLLRVLFTIEMVHFRWMPDLPMLRVGFVAVVKE